ncbi:hypothetical protein UFOVP585_49 [uncultured Caudovirales phage]|uniref:Uncharacterized protein n=1 Tax=uncultured Caudovirales phage TaxID=2100421 RepID=A0A6J5N8M3_9CAUD|nr:hypothetical protein UFOVP585_49 [uncultured Caudovirales phage]
MVKKTFEEWEIVRGMYASDLERHKTDNDITLEEFTKIVEDNMSEFVGVHLEDRLEFLKANGYETTRENLINADLSVRQSERDNAN